MADTPYYNDRAIAPAPYLYYGGEQYPRAVVCPVPTGSKATVPLAFTPPDGPYIYNAQLRYRRRIAPAKLATGEIESGSEEHGWTDWSQWQGSATLDSTGAHAVDGPHFRNGRPEVTPVSIETDGDVESYTLYEVQARVRELWGTVESYYGEASTVSSVKCYGPWVYSALRAGYRPKVTEMGASENGDGSLTVTANTEWGEGGNTVQVVAARVGGAWRRLLVGADGSDDGFAVTIPAGRWEAVEQGGKSYVPLEFYASSRDCLDWDFSGFNALGIEADNPEYGAASPELGKLVVSDSSIVESIEATPQGTGIVLNVATSKELDYAHACATWVDALGNPGTTGSMQMDGSGKAWSAYAPAVPLDTPVAFDVRMRAGDEWYAGATEAALESGGAVWLTDDDGDTVRVRLNVELSEDWEPEAEAVKPIGRQRAVSRYGTGGERTLKVSGELVRDGGGAGSDDWRAEFEALKQPRDWWLRTPAGEVFRVMVTAVSWATANETGNGIASVDISCKEVL